jgi:pimeloyl-ACP methyl ester carboxylesterase
MVTSVPETNYAKSGDISIAYQVMGDGPIDLVHVSSGFVSHLEFAHELPGVHEFFERLTSFVRLIRFDKRGTGLSDPFSGAPSLDDGMDDIRAVMDAAGSQRASLFGWGAGGTLSALFAATYPERVTALVLWGSYARALSAPDYPFGVEPDQLGWTKHGGFEAWGKGGLLDRIAPSKSSNSKWRSLFAKFERLSASPGTVEAFADAAMRIDIRPVLPTIRTPTLVLHRRDDTYIPASAGRYLAEHIPGARFTEMDGRDHLCFVGDADAVVSEVQEFLTGERPTITDPTRVLATVLFTDVVGSTKRASDLGDSRWRAVLDAHDDLVVSQVERFRGKLIKQTGDGAVATFDGPARAVTCASAIRDGIRALDLEIRAGLHIGEIELRGDDIGGIAVHIAARVLEKAEPGEVLVSRTLTDLVAGSDLRFEDRGEHELKGVAEKWQLFAAAV